MALLFMDGFDYYVTADILEKWSTTAFSGSGASTVISAANGRRGSGGWRYTTGSSTNTGYIRKVVVPGNTTAIMGFAMSVSGNFLLPVQIASFADTGSSQISLRLNTDLTLSVLRGATVLGTSAVALTVAVYNYIEWKVLIANTGGTVEVRLNGVALSPFLPLTGLDTQNTSLTQWNAALLGMFDSSANPGVQVYDFDDFYVLDGTGAAPWNTFLGDSRVDVRYPTAAGTTTGWTPSAGANWQCVDETAPNDDTDYVTAATAGLTDTFIVQDAPVAGMTIYGVQHSLSVKKMDAGAGSIAPVIRHGSTDYVGTAINPGTGYAYGLQIAAVNPGTGAAWVEADFNAAEFGYKRLG